MKKHDGSYEDMMLLSRPALPHRRRMSMTDRAAQFSPFAALVGYDDVLEETSRLTQQRIELDENEKYLLDIRNEKLRQHLGQLPQVTVTYFCPDEQKDGGCYVTVTGRLKNVAPHLDTMYLSDGTVIRVSDIISLDSPLFIDELQ